MLKLHEFFIIKASINFRLWISFSLCTILVLLKFTEWLFSKTCLTIALLRSAVLREYLCSLTRLSKSDVSPMLCMIYCNYCKVLDILQMGYYMFEFCFWTELLSSLQTCWQQQDSVHPRHSSKSYHFQNWEGL